MLSTITAAILAFVGSALAFPAPAPAEAAVVNAPAPYDYISLAAAGKVDFADSLSKRNLGGVRLSDGKNFTGHVWYGIYPLNTCVDLRDYAGNLLSFRPDEDMECLIMQGRCDGNNVFDDLYYNSTNIGDLSGYSWIGEVTSYICIHDI